MVMRPLLLVFCFSSLFGCSVDESAPVVLEDIVITEPRPGVNTSAGYLRIRNNRRETLTLTRVESPQFGNIEIHETTTIDGIARMRPLPALTIPANGRVILEQGGKHLMLMRPAADLSPIVLNFYAGDELLLSIRTEIAAE